MNNNLLQTLYSIIEGENASTLDRSTVTVLAQIPSVQLWLTRRPHLLTRLPPRVQEQLRAHAYRATAKSILRERELYRVLTLFHQANIQPVLLKGAAHLIAALYPHPALRPMGDIDLWVKEGDMPRAVNVLERTGYSIVHKARRPTDLRIHYKQEIELLGRAGRGEAVDLHYRPFQGMWVRLAARIPQKSLWKRRRVITWRQLPTSILSPEDHLIHLAYHFTVNHHLGHPGIRALLDMTLLLRRWPVDWARVCTRVHQWQVRTVTWVALTLVKRVASDLVPSAVLHRLAPKPWQQMLLRRLMPGTKDLLWPRVQDGRTRYLLKLLVCDSPRAWVRLIRWALWP